MAKSSKGISINPRSIDIFNEIASAASNKTAERFTGALPDILKPQFDKISRDFADFKNDVGLVLRTDFNDPKSKAARADREHFHEISYRNHLNDAQIVRESILRRVVNWGLGLGAIVLVYFGFTHDK